MAIKIKKLLKKLLEIIISLLGTIRKHGLFLYSSLKVIIIAFIVIITELPNANIPPKIMIVISLLLFILIDLFVFARVYLAKIKSNSEYILNSINIQNPDKLFDLCKLSTAQKCVFISGTNMKVIGKNIEKFSNINSNVRITFAISDVYNPKVKEYLIQSFGKSEKELMEHRNNLEKDISLINRNRKEDNKSEINIIYVDLFVPIAYVAIDYDEESPRLSSIIHAKHYFLGDDINGKTKTFNLSAHPTTELYCKYQEQIMLIEKHGENLSSHISRIKNKGENS